MRIQPVTEFHRPNLCTDSTTYQDSSRTIVFESVFVFCRHIGVPKLKLGVVPRVEPRLEPTENIVKSHLQ
jgi:hypothetical protein